MSSLRAYYRMILFVLVISTGLLFCIMSSIYPRKALQRNMWIRKQFVIVMSWLLGLRIIREGKVPPGIFLFASNHRSFSDPMIALHFMYAWPLAKAEVSKYPLIGFGARTTGVLFVKRESENSRRSAREAIESTLKEQRNVLIYPEGTTTNASTAQPFKGGSFEVASQMNIPVIPIAIEYQDPNDHWTDSTLWQHYMYQFGKRRSYCRIGFGSPIINPDPEMLRSKTQHWVDERLLEYRQRFDEGSY